MTDQPNRFDVFYTLDDEHHAIATDDIYVWAQWRRAHSIRVDETIITDDIYVSTIFLGIDHRGRSNGPPILFETMIFGGTFANNGWRYSSWDDAVIGHAAAVRKARHAAKVTGIA